MVWIRDRDREWKVPEISQFHYYDSDKKGCDYSNNWNSVVYGYEKFDSIPVYVWLRLFVLYPHHS